MKHPFYKYQGTGNDFIVIDNRLQEFDKNNAKLIERLCDRKFGIGADGLILLEDHGSLDFTMVYFNADGNQSSMCGNGGRCIVHFAKFLGIIEEHAHFEAIDGEHHAKIIDDLVHLQMQNVDQIKSLNGDFILDTGSPHFVRPVQEVKQIDVAQEGAKIRYSDAYKVEGINVNFVEELGNDKFAVRTYERGVENETLSCGTGVTAMALAMHSLGKVSDDEAILPTEGGTLRVTFQSTASGYNNIWLIGPAVQVFKGAIEW